MENSCPVCRNIDYTYTGKPKFNSISGKFIDKDYKVVQCTRCRVYYVTPKIDFTDEQWAKLYNSDYFALQSDWLLRKREAELKERFDKAEKLLRYKSDIKFLDIGTGEGKTLLEGSRRNWDVTGIDIVDNRNQEAKNSSINFIKNKFIEYNFPQNHFDFIYLDSVLEHVLNPMEYLIKIQEILKPEGILYIGVPNEDSLFNDVRKWVFRVIGKNELSPKIKPFDSPYHVIGFNTYSLMLIIKYSGLQIKYFRNFGRKMEFLGSPITNKTFWINLLFLFPVELIGYLIKRDVYFEAYVSK
jgi:2-polyprenyl-3-methyl-5-hydroxy-6-metoxy-1,4-benzoquinol methylase